MNHRFCFSSTIAASLIHVPYYLTRSHSNPSNLQPLFISTAQNSFPKPRCWVPVLAVAAFIGGLETTPGIAEALLFFSLGFPFSIVTWISSSTFMLRLDGIPWFVMPIFSICEFFCFLGHPFFVFFFWFFRPPGDGF